MAKYLLLKHYSGGPAPVNDVPMDRWAPAEVAAHIGYLNDFAARLESSGEFIDGQALSPDGAWVRYDGEAGRAASRLYGVARHGRLESLARYDAVSRIPSRPRDPVRH